MSNAPIYSDGLACRIVYRAALKIVPTRPVSGKRCMETVRDIQEHFPILNALTDLLRLAERTRDVMQGLQEYPWRDGEQPVSIGEILDLAVDAIAKAKAE